jgi:hypothetical protein
MTQPVVVRDPLWVRLLVYVGFPLAGAGVGWLLRWLAVWVAGLEWAPFQGPFKLLASVPQPWGTVVAVGLGVAAGLFFVVAAWQDSLTVAVGPESVLLRRGGKEREVPAAAVDAVFADGNRLVLLGSGGGELLRERSDLEAGALAAAFGAQGWRWLEADPFADSFVRWVEGDPRLPAAADVLLRARSRALDKGKAADALELRGELAKLGVVVREDRKRQYWRPAGPLPQL